MNMQTTFLPDARALAESGINALRNGDAITARRLFEKIIAHGAADASAFSSLAYACRRLNDATATLAAVDSALALEPQNIRALIFKADHMRSGTVNSYSHLSGNSGITAGPRTVWREGVLHAQEEISRRPTSAAQA